MPIPIWPLRSSDPRNPTKEPPMSALPVFEEPPATIPIGIYRPSDPRILNPGVEPMRRRHKPASNQETLWPTTVDPDVQAHAEAVEQHYRDPVVPEANRVWLRKSLGLRQFYADWMLPEREERVRQGKLSRGTLSKDRQALSRWERYSMPDDWSPEKVWPGIPIGSITGLYLGAVLERMKLTLDASTMRSTWFHLRTILNHAVKVRALDFAPKPERIKVEDKKVVTYRPDQIETAYRALAPWLDLQVAYVLAINSGLRSVDLFLLRRDQLDLSGSRPSMTFRAEKTGKLQTIPLAPVTIAQLLRQLKTHSDSYLFPGRSVPSSKEPEKTYTARLRRATISHALRSAGLFFPKPIQVARSTCNTRLEETIRGAGEFVLGHGLTLNARSYMDPSELVFDAINKVPQPACFSDF